MNQSLSIGSVTITATPNCVSSGIDWSQYKEPVHYPKRVKGCHEEIDRLSDKITAANASLHMQAQQIADLKLMVKKLTVV